MIATPADEQALATEVASVARLLSRAGLVEAFGHVSARCADGFLITTTAPLGQASAATVVALRADGEAPPVAEEVPLEAPLHAAVYAARPDVGAICRTHSPALVALGARGELPPLLHGLGGLAGEVRICSETNLVADGERASRAAAALAEGQCLILCANGGLATGESLAAAVVRAYYLEERCRTALEAGESGLELEAGDRLARRHWHEAEARRAWQWLEWRFGEAVNAALGEAERRKRGAAP